MIYITYFATVIKKANIKGVQLALGYDGLIVEKRKDGSLLYRVRHHRDKKRRISLSVGPDHYDFNRQYWDARFGFASAEDSIARISETGNLRRHVAMMVQKAKQRSKARGFQVEATVEYVLGLLAAQKCKCAITGIELDLRVNDGTIRRAFAPSIDRINPKLGYTNENIRITSLIANIAMSDLSYQDFEEMCIAVAARAEHG